jgi:hypothetical protein
VTPRALRSKIPTLPDRPPITTKFERELEKVSTWNREKVWYASQKEHWLGWLGEYRGPGFYNRKAWERTAEFVYNHIVCPPMVLWLGEASGVPTNLIRKAKDAALTAGPNLAAKASAIRKIVSWEVVELHLMDKITTTIEREWLREIAAGRKVVEYREIKPYWVERLSKVKTPFVLRLINGMDVNAPEVTVRVARVRRNTSAGRFELHLGKVLDLKRWNLACGAPSQLRRK